MAGVEVVDSAYQEGRVPVPAGALVRAQVPIAAGRCHLGSGAGCCSPLQGRASVRTESESEREGDKYLLSIRNNQGNVLDCWLRLWTDEFDNRETDRCQAGREDGRANRVLLVWRLIEEEARPPNNGRGGTCGQACSGQENAWSAPSCLIHRKPRDGRKGGPPGNYWCDRKEDRSLRFVNIEVQPVVGRRRRRPENCEQTDDTGYLTRPHFGAIAINSRQSSTDWSHSGPLPWRRRCRNGC